MADFFSRFRRGSQAATAETDVLDRWIRRGDDEVAAWDSARPGPAVDDISARISSVPKVFLDDAVDLVALAGDVFDDLYRLSTAGGPPAERRSGVGAQLVETLADIASSGVPSARQAAAIGLWVYASTDEIGPITPPLSPFWAPRVIAALAWRLSSVVPPSEWVSDAERRDEAARVVLLWSGCLPAGEDLETARSLFAMRDSLQRNQAMAAALAEQRHRLEVKRKLEEARAREAAARPSME
ncbi:phosphohydrolase [Frondihabitans australicus]|uniref:phosphohydrolase n=1 Tax=Frondihabitans australicus TaxID=386892 RepID=UPI001FE93315|nr:phosphohydrolase [Frondihabitans australicus]